MRLFQKLGLDEIYGFQKGVLRSFSLLFFMFIILRADQMVMSPLIPDIQNEFAIGDYEIGLIGSAFTLVAAIVTLFWGYLSDKYSRKWLLVSAVLVGEIPCLLTAFARSYEELLILRIFTGVGIGGLVPVAFSMLGDLFTEKQRPRAQAWYQAMGAVGTLVGMVAAGFIGPALGWRVPFIIVSLPNFFFILAIIFGGAEPQRGAGELAVKDLVLGGKEYTRTLRVKDYLRMIVVPSNVWLFLQGIPGTVAWGVIPYYLVTFYTRYKGLSTEAATILLLILGLGVIVGNLLGGILGNRLYLKNRRYLPVFCGLSQLVGVVPLIATLAWPAPAEFSLGAIAAPALLGLVGAALIGTAGPNVQAMLINVNLPEHRGGISSIFNLTDSIGAGFGPYIGGLISASFGLDFAMRVSVLFWIPCGILFFVLALTLPRDTERVHQAMEEVREVMIHSA